MADDPHRRRVAVELNALHWSGALGDVLEGARIGTGTPIYDLNGELLFERLPLNGPGVDGFADVALHPAMGTVLMTVSPATPWDEASLEQDARQAADRVLAPDGLPGDANARFVAYSLPKLAVQFRADDHELAMLELWSWEPVPAQRRRDPTEPPSHFERWSYLDELPADVLAAKRAFHEDRVAANGRLVNRERLEVDLIARDQFAPIAEASGSASDSGTAGGEPGPTADSGGGGAGPAPTASDQRSLHFSMRPVSHAMCYENVKQETPKWCVAASMQMLLDFYRYGYDQDRLATDLGLGTKAAPVALPNGQEDRVVQAIDAISSKALGAAKVALDWTMPLATWQVFRNEILCNRPAISFVWGHSRTVAGFTDQAAANLGFKGLVVYDPLGPTGAGFSLEDVAYQLYTFAFTAKLRLV